VATSTPTRASDRAARSASLRRQRLLNAALVEFSRQGYSETSVDDIVSRARTSKSAFYAHFDSKERCFRALLEEEGGGLMSAVQAAAQAGSDHRQRLRAGIDAFVSQCSRHADLGRLLLVQSVGLSPEVEMIRQHLQNRFAEMVELEIRHAAARGSIPPDIDPEIFARSVVGGVGEVTAHLLRSGGDARSTARALMEIFAP